MKTFKEFIEEARKLQQISTPKKSGVIPIPGSEGKARKDVAVAGFRGRGPVQDPKVTTDWKMKGGPDVATYIRTHSSPSAFAANVAKKAYKEGEKNVRSTVKGLKQQLHGVKGAVHDVTLGKAKSKLSPSQKARAFLGAVKGVRNKAIEAGAKPGDIVVNKPSNISASGQKPRSDAEGAAKRGAIYSRAGMSPISTKTGYQTAKVPGGSSSLPSVGPSSNKKKFTPGEGPSFGISGIKLAN